jgi:hypothetical protein
MGFKLVNDVGDIDGDVVVVRNAVGGAGSGGNVVRLAGVCDAEVVLGKSRRGCQKVREWCVGISDQGVEAGVLHHDDEDVPEVTVVIAIVFIFGLHTDRSCLKNEGKHDCPHCPHLKPISKIFSGALSKHPCLLS